MMRDCRGNLAIRKGRIEVSFVAPPDRFEKRLPRGHFRCAKGQRNMAILRPVIGVGRKAGKKASKKASRISAFNGVAAQFNMSD